MTQGAGTGFIIDKAGFILTNNHVVEGADVIRVSLFGGGRQESYAAKVVGRDVLTDSALIQLTIEVSTLDILSRLLNRLDQLPNVIEARRQRN